MVEPLPRWARVLVAAVALLGLVGVATRWWPSDEPEGFFEVSIQQVTLYEEREELLVDLNACTQEGRVTVTAVDRREVRLLAEAFDPSETEDCGYTAMVRLDSPLADRTVVDEVTGEAVTVQKSS